MGLPVDNNGVGPDPGVGLAHTRSVLSLEVQISGNSCMQVRFGGTGLYLFVFSNKYCPHFTPNGTPERPSDDRDRKINLYLFLLGLDAMLKWIGTEGDKTKICYGETPIYMYKTLTRLIQPLERLVGKTILLASQSINIDQPIIKPEYTICIHPAPFLNAIELLEQGSSIDMNEENELDYVELLNEAKAYFNIFY